MDLRSIGRLVGERRRARKLTLPELAAAAGIARSTLAALESGKLAELGFNKVARVCAAVDLAIDVRAPTLDAPLMDHRHLTDMAGRELTKAAIDDIISRGDVTAWRGLVRAIQGDDTGRVIRRVQDVLRALSAHDPKARGFALMLPKLKAKSSRPKKRRGQS
jgi:transcriptional regulator with XRE-family HTH domain